MMKVINKDEATIRIVLKDGRKEIKPGETVEIPDWAFRMLKPIYTHLTPVETVVIEAEPAETKIEEQPKVAKSAKGKKPRK